MEGYPSDGYGGAYPPWLMGSGAVPLDIGFLSGDRLLYNRGALIVGYSVREASGTPALATVEIRDGGASNGTFVFAWNIAASGDRQAWGGTPPIVVTRGIFAHVITGALVGSLFLIPNA